MLIIDDEADIREVVTAALEAHGFEVEVMRDGIDALELPDRFDAILLDVQMPVFDGERLLDYWSMTNPGLLSRVIVMTGYSHRHPRWKPAYAIVEKPFRYEEIIRLVSECVEKRPRPSASTS